MPEQTRQTPREKETSKPSSDTKEREHKKVETPAQMAQRKFEEAKKRLSRIRGEKKEREEATKEIEAGTNTEPGKTNKKQESQPDDSAKKEEEKVLKETFDALSEKHKTEVREALFAKNLVDIDADARNMAHNEIIYSLVPEQKKGDVRRELEKDHDFAQLSENEKEEKIRAQVLSRLGGLPRDLQKAITVDAEKRDIVKLQEQLQKQLGFDAKQADEFLKKALDEDAVKETILKGVLEDGMLVSGVGLDTPLGKELKIILNQNIGEYLGISPSATDIIDIDNFKNLGNVMKGGYKDILYSKHFLLGENHPLKKARDMVLSSYNDEVTQIPDLENASNKEQVQEYKKQLQDAYSHATGLEGADAEKALQKMSHQNISPVIRFFADLFAPLGALMSGSVGDFWRNYLQQRESDSRDENGSRNENYEQYGTGSEGIEGLQPGSILAAANKYMGVNEAKDGGIISQMHASAGLKAGPATPWCMSFVQHVLRKDMGYSSEQIGIGPSASAAAGHRIGRHTDTPQLGDIVLIRRKGGSGRHIAFFAGFEGDRVKLLGGNQGNSVSVSTYSKSSVVEYRTLQKTGNVASTKGSGENPSQSSSESIPAIASGQDTFPNTTLGADKYPSREFLKKNGMSPESVPMGMRVNNPLNIKFTGSSVQRSLFSGVLGKSEHTDQGDPQIVFSSPEAGLISGMNLLLYKQKHRNFNTIYDMIANVPNGWTQGGPNNSLGKNAAREIAQRAGIGVNDPLDLKNPDMMKRFMQALIIQEHGNAGRAYFSLLDKVASQAGTH